MRGWDTVFIVPPYNQCFRSGKFIPDPDFYPSRIPDPKKAMKETGENKFVVKPFFWAINFTSFIFEMLNKKIWANFQRLIELFTQKLSLSSQKYGFGIRDPGVKKAPDPGSGSAALHITVPTYAQDKNSYKQWGDCLLFLSPLHTLGSVHHT